MQTIRGKIIAFFMLCLAFAGALALLYYQNASSLRRKIYAIEQFDDLLNDVLELRRYEKNFLFYKDQASRKEGMIYLERIDDDYSKIKQEIVGIVGQTANASFERRLQSYHRILAGIVLINGPGGYQPQEESLRAEGKGLVEFAQNLIQKKRHIIDQTLKRGLTIPLASIGFLILLALFIFRFVTTGILKPLQMVENATEKVAKESFTPIAYDKDKQDEITRLIASFNKMVNELDTRQEQLVQSRKLASIGTLTSGIAHELNNPLNNISITAEAFRFNYPNMSAEEVEEMIEDILTQTDRASQVVKNLLEFSRTERPGLRHLDIQTILERTLRLIKNQIIVTHFNIKKEIAPYLPAIRGRQQDLQQAFVNILLNAIQAMPEGGTIAIRADRGPNGYLQVDLSDSGAGIPNEALEHIFDPFYTTKASGQGTGLGLSIVYNIIKTHNGYIEVKSEINSGTTFSIFLPTAAAKEATQDEI